MIEFINLAVAILLFIIGVLVRLGKVEWLISGFNTASKKEKEKYDMDKLFYYFGNFIFVLASLWALISIALFILPNEVFLITTIGTSVVLVAMVIGIIYLNTNNRVKK